MVGKHFAIMLLPDRAGRRDNIVSARSGDLERALDRVLPHDVRNRGARCTAAARQAGDRGESGRRPFRWASRSSQAGRRQHGDAGGIGGLGRVLLWDKYRSEAGVPHGERHRKCAAHRTSSPVRDNSPRKTASCGRGSIRPRPQGWKAESEGHRRRRPFGIRGSEVDRQAGNRPVEAADLTAARTRSQLR